MSNLKIADALTLIIDSISEFESDLLDLAYFSSHGSLLLFILELNLFGNVLLCLKSETVFKLNEWNSRISDVFLIFVDLNSLFNSIFN